MVFKLITLKTSANMLFGKTVAKDANILSTIEHSLIIEVVTCKINWLLLTTLGLYSWSSKMFYHDLRNFATV